MSGLGTMRTWEALEQGAIPVIEDWSEYHNVDGDTSVTQSGGSHGKSRNWTVDAMQSYLGRYGNLEAPPPLPMVHHTWRDAVHVLSPLLQATLTWVFPKVCHIVYAIDRGDAALIQVVKISVRDGCPLPSIRSAR